MSLSIVYRHVKSWGALCLFVLIQLQICDQALARSRHPDHSGLSKFSSRHYKVYTNLHRSIAAEYAQHMDMVYAEYSHRFRSFRKRAYQSLPLYLFKTRGDYMGFLSKHGIDGSGSGGMFFVYGHVRGLATWTKDRSRRRIFAVLQHEGFHQFAFARIGTNLPKWINEGLAEYFEKGILVRGKFSLGLVPVENLDYVKHALQENREIEFDDLFRMSGRQWNRNMTGSGDLGYLQYQQSWSIVHFLVHANQGRYQNALMKYLRLVNKGKASDVAFLEAFKSRSTRAFRERWEEYTNELESDAIGTTLDRMSFLGEGLKHLLEKEKIRPTNLADLRDQLQKNKFWIYVWRAGKPAKISSMSEELYRCPEGMGVNTHFELLEPAADNLPQRIGASGAKPEPILTWRFDGDGELVSDFEFR